MRFNLRRSYAGGAAADPDPLAAPASVPDELLLKIPHYVPGSDAKPRRLLLSASGTALQTFSVEVWILDEENDLSRGASAPELPTQAQKAARKFYLTTTTALTVTVNEVVEHTAILPGEGKAYIRATAVPAADAVLLVAVD